MGFSHRKELSMTAIPLISDKKNAVRSVLLFGILFAACFTPFSLWSLMFLYLLGCCALCTVTLTAGVLPALLCLALSAAGMYQALGMGTMVCVLAYLVPTWLLFMGLYMYKVRYLYCFAAMIACQVVTQTAIFLVLNLMVGGELFAKAAETVCHLLADSEFGDMLLISMSQYGLIGLSGDLLDGAVMTTDLGYVLSDSARQELLLSLRSLVISTLTALLPGMLISQSIETGLLCHMWPRHRLARRHAAPEELTEMPAPPKENELPHISYWHIPRPWGLRIGILGAGYFLSSAQNGALSMLGQMFFSLFTCVFAIQGLATLNFVQHKRGTSYPWRVALPIILTLMLPNTLTFLGIMDQMTNMRMLRPPKHNPDEDRNPFDEF